MVVSCIAKGCENKQRRYLNTMFHRIPPNVERRTLWLAALGIPIATPVEKISGYRVCEEHFTPEDYEMKMQYATKKMIQRLKNTAVPSIFNTETKQNASSIAASIISILFSRGTLLTFPWAGLWGLVVVCLPWRQQCTHNEICVQMNP